MDEHALEHPIDILEATLARTRRLTAAAAAVPLFIFVGAIAAAPPKPSELVASKLTIVDDRGVPRVVIGQDPKSTERVSRAAGVYIRDKLGYERGGFGTFDDGSVALAMDAPHGVGASVPDRIGMLVSPKGQPKLLLIDNHSHRVVQLRSSGDDMGAIDLFAWKAEKPNTRTLTSTGDQTDSKAAVAPIRS
jgi:hypothetical protein